MKPRCNLIDPASNGHNETIQRATAEETIKPVPEDARAHDATHKGHDRHEEDQPEDKVDALSNRDQRHLGASLFFLFARGGCQFFKTSPDQRQIFTIHAARRESIYVSNVDNLVVFRIA